MESIHLRKRDRNVISAVLSVFPGLGHLYKHHYIAGLGIMTVGNLLMIFIAIWLSFATMGLSLLLVPAAYLLGVGFSAFELEDWHGKHVYLHPWRDDS